MIGSWDRGDAKATYETDILVKGTEPQKDRNRSVCITGHQKLDAYTTYAYKNKPHVPSITQEELNNSKMPDWEAEEHRHTWDKHGFCDCGRYQYDD